MWPSLPRRLPRQRFPVTGLQRIEGFQDAYAVVQLLTGGRPGPGLHGVDFSEFKRVHAHFPGQDIHLGFACKGGLYDGHTTHGACHRIVRVDGDTFYIDVFDFIGPRDVDGGPHGQGRAVR